MEEPEMLYRQIYCQEFFVKSRVVQLHISKLMAENANGHQESSSFCSNTGLAAMLEASVLTVKGAPGEGKVSKDAEAKASLAVSKADL